MLANIEDRLSVSPEPIQQFRDTIEQATDGRKDGVLTLSFEEYALEYQRTEAQMLLAVTALDVDGDRRYSRTTKFVSKSPEKPLSKRVTVTSNDSDCGRFFIRDSYVLEPAATDENITQKVVEVARTPHLLAATLAEIIALTPEQRNEADEWKASTEEAIQKRYKEMESRDEAKRMNLAWAIDHYGAPADPFHRRPYGGLPRDLRLQLKFKRIIDKYCIKYNQIINYIFIKKLMKL